MVIVCICVCMWAIEREGESTRTMNITHWRSMLYMIGVVKGDYSVTHRSNIVLVLYTDRLSWKIQAIIYIKCNKPYYMVERWKYFHCLCSLKFFCTILFLSHRSRWLWIFKLSGWTIVPILLALWMCVHICIHIEYSRNSIIRQGIGPAARLIVNFK